MLVVASHPLLELYAFETTFPRVLEEIPSSPELLSLLRADAAAPMASDDSIREAVRALLRHGGFKPTGGRSRPRSISSRRSAKTSLAPVNLAADACNAVSLHSGLPISVVDLNRARPPFRVEVAPGGSSYVFNASGQVIDLSGLLCWFDVDGPCPTRSKTRNGAKPRVKRDERCR